jgi:ribosome biogenesis GTPase
LAKRKKIKANRKPKIVRDRSWKTRVLRGEIEEVDLELPRVERILPRGREEERVKLWTKVEEELALETVPRSQEEQAPAGWRKGVVIGVSIGLYNVDLSGDGGTEPMLCSVRGSLSASETGYTNVVVVGDRVWVSGAELGSGVIERVLDRRTVLARPDVFHPDRSQIIVSNVDQLLIVASWQEPEIWMELIDRSLIAAAEGKVEPLICLNKVDLAEDQEVCREEMRIYQELGHTVLFTSAVTGQGVDELRVHLIGRETVLTGLSGVGKSSLLMAVQPDLKLRVADVSDASGEGRHTTAQVSLLKLDQGGYVVDTPGIRELGLIKVRRHELVLYYPEIAALARECRFNDCSHTHEPGCVVIEAVEEERISWSRYHSYQSIYESLPEYYTE